MTGLGASGLALIYWLAYILLLRRSMDNLCYKFRIYFRFEPEENVVKDKEIVDSGENITDCFSSKL